MEVVIIYTENTLALSRNNHEQFQAHSSHRVLQGTTANILLIKYFTESKLRRQPIL